MNVADVTLSNQVDIANLQQFIDLLYQIGEIPEQIDAHRLVDPDPMSGPMSGQAKSGQAMSGI